MINTMDLTENNSERCSFLDRGTTRTFFYKMR